MPADSLTFTTAAADLAGQRREALATLYDQPAVRLLAAAARREGFRLWVVGGPVRDCLLGRATDDLDLLTDAPRDAVRPLLRAAGGIGQVAGATIGTVSGRLPVGEGVCRVDLSPLRAPTSELREFGDAGWDALAWDLALRDLTVNAMALDAIGGVLHDPTDGVRALRDKVLTTPLPAAATFSMDPVRMVRAVRFAATLSMDLSPGVGEHLREHGGAIAADLNPRLFTELLKADRFGPGALVRMLLLCDELGLLDRLVAVGDRAALAQLSSCGPLPMDEVLRVLSQGCADPREAMRSRGVPRARAQRIHASTAPR